MFEDRYLELLSEELLVALGCTEPAAIALAAATARKYLKGQEIVRISVNASTDVIKNAMNVKIAGTNSCGIGLAAAIGALNKQNQIGLEIFEGLDSITMEKAGELILSGKVSVNTAESKDALFIEVILETINSVSRAVLEKTHTNITLIEADGEIITESINKENRKNTSFITIESIWKFINHIDIKKLGIIKQTIELNKAIGKEGLENAYGLQVGRTIMNKLGNGILPDNIFSYAMALTSAGCDARMAGSPLKVMSNSGSGNQGIASTLPVLAIWEKTGLSEEKLIRAVALSNLITIHIKLQFGRISALCGATIAAAGASCGITYLLGGGITEIKSSIQNIAGNLTGMLCDGAKAGCALKISTCTGAAVLSALMAIDGVSIQPSDGIIENNPEKTISNISTLGNKGALEADKIILSILLKKENAKVKEAY